MSSASPPRPPYPEGTPAIQAARFQPGMNGRQLLGIIFRVCRELRVSDIQMRSGRPVYIHTNKGMEMLDFLGILSATHMDEILKELIRNRENAGHGFGVADAGSHVEEQIAQAMHDFTSTKVADFSCDGIPMGEAGERSGRLRIQAHLSSSGLGVTCRILNDFIPELEQLGIDPDTIATLRHASLKRAGLCLVTGPTGSGKSTTLASLIDWVRRHHPKHIVTVEDPIEYQYPDDMPDPVYPGHRTPSPSIVTQQEVGRDVHSYRQGLKDVLRKAPHIILLGEIRDREAMETCMEAAQTGHLVLSTLHTTGAVKTLGRILELYPNESHTAVLSRLSEILIFIHSQGLLNGVNRRVLTYEFLHNSEDAISSAIANYDGGARSLEDVIHRAGNVQWDNNLKRLLQQGLISYDTFENARMNRADNEVF
ncbi:ATPase, T2SS/T4P/T4SS family [Luteolibacter sp. SL250]|uniref:type IV pilus twitching motility protein PilT n=1 Tax=Luteolibacter sp. SL250 TaxID=2995170 RepID=UPI00227213BC|nr:ATPase, T2SS/T4P/T4SS family [Luteolibacter sp. SL250]WAC21571.1 ATPase, T2SS/T4P/T4SS family [Luteolibacter sp. SL250]